MIRARICETIRAHSARSAAVSKENLSGVPIQEIMKKAGRSNQSTLAKFYNKKVSKQGEFENKVPKC